MVTTCDIQKVQELQAGLVAVNDLWFSSEKTSRIPTYPIQANISIHVGDIPAQRLKKLTDRDAGEDDPSDVEGDIHEANEYFDAGACGLAVVRGPATR